MSGNDPSEPTEVSVFRTPAEVLNSTLAMNVDPLYSAAAIGVVARNELGVKPVPLIDTPMVVAVPATKLDEPSTMAGVPRIVKIVLAELPAASVTVTLSAPEVCAEDTTKPTVLAAYRLPFD